MKRWFYRILSLMLSFGILGACLLCCASYGDRTENRDASSSPLPAGGKALQKPEEEPLEKEEQMRGVWVPFMCLDMTGTDRSEESFRLRMKEICENISSIGCNTLILQVRPFGDALYTSSYYPSSHLIVGEQGNPMTFDPLAVALTEAKRCHLRLHAWVNPFRVQTQKTPSLLSSDNPAQQWITNPDSEKRRNVLTTENGLMLNPASEEVRKLIINGVREIASRYEVDGIQIDDYFYPDNDEECDREEYEAYCKKAGDLPLSHSEWRKQNINSLISGMAEAIHEAREGCVFGISPQCNLENNEKMGADVEAWGAVKGYADYLCPQVYVSPDHPYLPFAEAIKEWRELIKNPDAAFYVGIALYKLGTDADEGTWLLRDGLIAEECRCAEENGADGVMLYSYEYLMTEQAQQELQQAFSKE